MIIILACCAVVGFMAGLVLRLPAFTILCLLAVAGYAVFRTGIESGWQITYQVVLIGIALQIGYFVAIVTQTVFRSLSRSKQLRTRRALAVIESAIRISKDEPTDSVRR